MEIFQWSSNYNIGVEDIDFQHKHLIDVINKLIIAKNNHHSTEILREVLAEVVDYTHYHFETEEKHMEMRRYDRLAEHKSQHKVLIKQIVKILEELRTNQIQIDDELLLILKNWFIRHVLDHDKEYGYFLHNK